MAAQPCLSTRSGSAPTQLLTAVGSTQAPLRRRSRKTICTARKRLIALREATQHRRTISAIQGIFRRWSMTRRKPHTLRGLIDFRFEDRTPDIPPDEVEPAIGDSEALQDRCYVHTAPYRKKRMSCMAIAMNRLGGKSNTGEGGEDPGEIRDREEQRDKAGRLRALRRHGATTSLSAEGNPDKNGSGRKAGRGRSSARKEGLSVDREDPLLDPRCGAHLPAAAPRYLLDRGSGAADIRPEKREPQRQESPSSWSPRRVSEPLRQASPRRERRSS